MTTLNQRIQDFYDRSTGLWLDVWGEHMHHGFYDEKRPETKSHREAQVRLVMEMLRWGKVESAQKILDAGCGVGGSARLLARLFDAEVLGCTLSPVQAQRGQEYNRSANLQEKVQIQVQDMMQLSKKDGPFDLIWSMESAEHIREKQQLLDLFYDLLEPGGKLLLATWFHRETPPDFSSEEKKLLNGIYDYYHLPPIVSIPELQQMAVNSRFQNVQIADWTAAVAPFWRAVIRSTFKWSSLKGLWKAGWPVIKGAWAMRYMTKGFRKGILKFGVLQGQKV